MLYASLALFTAKSAKKEFDIFFCVTKQTMHVIIHNFQSPEQLVRSPESEVTFSFQINSGKRVEMPFSPNVLLCRLYTFVCVCPTNKQN